MKELGGKYKVTVVLKEEGSPADGCLATGGDAQSRKGADPASFQSP